MGWLMTLGILVLLAAIPLGVWVRYDADGAVVKVIAGPVKIQVFPLPKKTKKEEKKPEKQAPVQAQEDKLPKPPQPPKQEKNQQKGGSLLDFLPLVKLAVRFLGDFRRKLRVKDLQLKLILAGGDPCDLAVNYGKACAAAANLLPRLESWFTIKKRDIAVECDFTASETLIFAHLDLTITLGRLLSLVVVYGVRALMEFMNLKKKRKGGAVT